jgi:Rps23 Pro-64 3,4-dihydroxylase Tpa1-like proline 4-hydroxylase
VARERFAKATTTDGKLDARCSEVLYDFGSIAPDFASSLEACMPLVQQLFLELGDSWTTELQVTAHGDGDYFALHNDSGSPVTAGRTVSFVYYFNQEPACFTGGDLVIYDSPLERPDQVSPSKHTVPPAGNTLVFFRSSAWHEVMPVTCPSNDFRQRRFTINGWLSAGSPSTSQEENE